MGDGRWLEPEDGGGGPSGSRRRAIFSTDALTNPTQVGGFRRGLASVGQGKPADRMVCEGDGDGMWLAMISATRVVPNGKPCQEIPAASPNRYTLESYGQETF